MSPFDQPGRERLAWVALVAVALWLRVWDLDVRTMSHDESLHAFLSYRLLTEGVYQHDPVYHGPFLYHLSAVVFFLFGATDATARLAPTLSGVALVAGVWYWRPLLGRAGAWLAAAFITCSPTLLFYSRHIRNDIFIAVFTLAWAYALLRYLDTPDPRWRRLLTVAMTLSFMAKEVSFITGAVFGMFVVLVALWPRRDCPATRRAAAIDLAVHMLALVVPFSAGAIFPWFGWPAVGPAAAATLVGPGGLVVAALFGTTLALGSVRFGWRQWLPTAGLFWGLLLTFFTTVFTNVPAGLASGIVGSLGYWLTQQEVARAGQPWFYYGLVGVLYEFLPLALAAVALIVGLWRGRHAAWDPGPSALAAADDWAGRGGRRLWLVFAAWWTGASWFAYAIAGEKMPWLLVHQILPVCLVAGWGVARFTSGLTTARFTRHHVLAIVATAGAAVVLVTLVRTTPFAGRTVEAVTATASWWTRVVWLAGLVAVAAVSLGRPALTWRGRTVVIGVLTPLAVLWLRATLQVNFVHVDLATEPMSYAQASPDVRRVMREVARLDDRLGGLRQVRVAVDDETSWPFSWYLRDYPRTVAWGQTPALAADADIVLVGPLNRPRLTPQVAQGYVRQRGILYWWPLQGYRSLTPASLLALFGDATAREALWQIVMHRRYGIALHEWPARRDFEMFVREDAAALIGLGGTAASPAGLTLADPPPWTPRSVIAGPFDGRPLVHPTAVSVGPDGRRVIADSGNHRVVVLAASGQLLFTIGSGRCALLERDQPGCLDADGRGGRPPGAGQFNEPWGVAIGRRGEIVVADTWNGRIQVFDAHGVFVSAWGRFGRVTPGIDDRADPLLFGPRGLAVTADGDLVVADTGNNRLVVATFGGERRAVVGPGVAWPPPLAEPTSVTWDPNQTLLVADLWNQRIVRVDRLLRPLAVWKVPAWESRAAEDKAALAVDADGRVYAVDPASGRVFVFAPSGALLGQWAVPQAEGQTATPTGIAAADSGRTLLVVDRRGGRVLEMPALVPTP